jgi:mannose-1-phosphate guanylyltransferase/mannose-6-phosphate isomerase
MRGRKGKIIRNTTKPWGEFHQYTFNETSTVKTLVVNPGKRLSDQRHKNRHELWIFQNGGGKVSLEYLNGRKKEIFPKIGEEVKIFAMTWHRLECLSTASAPLRVTEISFGKFDEDDIERRSDDFGRK